MRVRIRILPKPGILDPQGKAIINGLVNLGYKGIDEARQGKIIELNLREAHPLTVRQSVEDMCQKLLANPVIEEYQIEIDPSDHEKSCG